MALTTQTMTDEQRKSVALEYLKAFDNGGTTSTGDVTGTNATGTQVNSLYTIFGKHTYPRQGTYHGTVVVSAGNAGPVRAAFTAVWP